MNSETRKKLIGILSVPCSLLALYLVFWAVWRFLDLPSDESLMATIGDFFSRYGLWVVFISSLIEGFLILGQYFPGGTVIFLGVISAGEDVGRAVEVVIVVSLAFFISYAFNYLIGKYGWYKLLIRFGMKGSLEDAKRKLQKHDLSAVIFSYWEPNLASITATAAGILNIPILRFLAVSAGGILIWNTFWGTLVFSLGANALKIIGLKYVLVIFCAWVAFLLVKHYFTHWRDLAESKRLN